MEQSNDKLNEQVTNVNLMDSHNFECHNRMTPDLIARAEQEVNEKDHWRCRDIEALRDMITSESLLKCRLDDSFLLRFLRARRFDYDGAFQLLCDYFRLQRTNGELFPSIDQLRHLFEANIIGQASGRSIADEAVFLLRLGIWNPNKFSFDDILAASIKVMEWMIVDDNVTQINGIVLLIDMTGFGWSQLRKFGPNLAKKCIFIMEKCLPIRIKTIYVINESSIADFGFTIIKPFISEELNDKIRFCGYNFNTTVHQHINPEFLPYEYGGTRGNLSSLPLYEQLELYESIKNANEAGHGYGLIKRQSFGSQFRPSTSRKCTPGSCTSRNNQSNEADLNDVENGTSGSDMRNFFRKSQTCNGYLFDYYNNTSSID